MNIPEEFAKTGIKCKYCNRVMLSDEAWNKHINTQTHKKHFKETKKLLGYWVTKKWFDEYSRKFVMYNKEERRWI